MSHRRRELVLIVALEFYQRYAGHPPSKRSKEIEDLSKTISKIRQDPTEIHDTKFRNINGVCMKLMNFRRFDLNFINQGKVGLGRGGKLEELVWNEFYSKIDSLTLSANSIINKIYRTF